MSVFLCNVFSPYTFVFTYLWPMYENNFPEKLPTPFIEHWQSCFFLGIDKKMSLAIFPSVKVELGIRYCIVVMTLTCGDDPVVVSTGQSDVLVLYVWCVVKKNRLPYYVLTTCNGLSLLRKFCVSIVQNRTAIRESTKKPIIFKLRSYVSKICIMCSRRNIRFFFFQSYNK